MLINGSTQKYKAKILLEKHSLVTFPTSETILSLRAERSEREKQSPRYGRLLRRPMGSSQ